MTIEEIIDKHWAKMFEELMSLEGDTLTELLIEVQVGIDGKTLRRSWKERNHMLRDED